jgi:hypothetical protein
MAKSPVNPYKTRMGKLGMGKLVVARAARQVTRN